MLPDRDHRPVVKAARPALVADQTTAPILPWEPTLAIATEPLVMRCSPGGAVPATTSSGPPGAAAAAGS